MIVCPEHNLAFLLPWKTASQTLKKRLSFLNRSPYPDYYYFNSIIGRVVHQHITLSDFQRLPEYRPDIQIAVFVRNPYDRVFSGFLQMIKDLRSQPGRLISDAVVMSQVLEQLRLNLEGLKEANFDFNRWFQRLPDYFFYDRDRNTSLPIHPMTYWTHDGKVLRARFLGRVENFEIDFQRLCRQFSLTNVASGNANVSFEEWASLSTTTTQYRYLKYFQPETLARVNEIFSEDFRSFGYTVQSGDLNHAAP